MKWSTASRAVLIRSKSSCSAPGHEGGEAPDSDYDLLVVMSSCADRRRSAIALRSALADVLAGKDIVVATSAEMKAKPGGGSAIVRSAAKEGRVAYERQRPVQVLISALPDGQ